MELNLGVLIAQFINFAIILFLFKWLVGDKITQAVVARRAELIKAENAAVAYEQAVTDAETAKQELINEGLAHKVKLVSEAEAVAKKREETILEAANKKAMQIEDAANTQADQMKASISSEFEKTVKDATKIVVGRLVETSPNIKKDYLDSLVKEFVAAK